MISSIYLSFIIIAFHFKILTELTPIETTQIQECKFFRKKKIWIFFKKIWFLNYYFGNNNGIQFTLLFVYRSIIYYYLYIEYNCIIIICIYLGLLFVPILSTTIIIINSRSVLVYLYLPEILHMKIQHCIQ